VIVRALTLPDVFEIIPKKHGDARGFFSETFSARAMTQHDLPGEWVQDNFSLSAAKYVLRGLHYQTPPKAQDKLVRVLRGSILDVAVDIRKGSPHFGKWVSLVLSHEAWNQILVPKGFAHGFLTLEPDTEVAYKVSDYYSLEHDRGIAWNDPDIGIAWPLDGAQPHVSDKDAKAPRLKEVDLPFVYKEKSA
jgi:dTDP-4-dehydrorhamnose 3,5-epimerase